jgi:hypothetical protein
VLGGWVSLMVRESLVEGKESQDAHCPSWVASEKWMHRLPGRRVGGTEDNGFEIEGLSLSV